MTAYKRHLITAALPYANGPIHLGHLAGAYLPSDIYVRYMRLKREDVLFVCGSDEHGAAITIRAKKEGVSPQEIVDRYDAMCKKSFAEFGIDFDIYHRTSSELHKETASNYFLELLEKEAFEVRESEQYFDEEAQQFLADRYITGTCPKCANDSAYGDQCEKCGSALSPTDLINPKSTLSGNPPVLRTTTHWYLPMQDHEKWLKEWINEGTLDGKPHHNPKDWKNHVVGQCNSWIDGGLQPRAMTRDLDWGVPVPVEGAEGKVLYVWLDAPIGYISATKQWAADNGKNWEDYWKKEETRLVHFIGKDNIVFHCIIFPILLKAHGEYILPENVPANEFLNLEGQKLSTSRNWAVWLHEYLEEYPDRIDALRYVITSILPENKDSEFTWKDFQARNNNELVAILGNFVNRAVVLTHKYFDGKVPTADFDQDVLNEVTSHYEKVASNLDKFSFRQALADAMNVARIGNKYLADNEPWKTIKTDEVAAQKVISTSLVIAEHLKNVIAPFLPNTSEKLAHILNVSASNWSAESTISAGHQLNAAELLFTKFEDEEVEKQVEKLKQASAATQTVTLEPAKPETTFEDFQKLDIRIATIIEAEKVAKTKKLLKLKVDTGFDQRTVVSGIAEFYSPEEIIGKQVCLLANLAPRAIKGIESQGMILMAESPDGKLSFVLPNQAVVNGSSIS
ncbi:MAG: methionine--tRNA ligase [Flavobacteriales bacterium]|nr:methionine--tRNA ligase [Flavobacteriales bacterium]